MSRSSTAVPSSWAPPDAELRRDDVLATLMILVGGIRIAIAVVGGDPAASEATVAGLMVMAGLAILLWRRR